MSQGILTNAGRDLFAAKQGAGQVLTIDRFLLANIAGLDPNTPADPDEALPALGDRVAELPVTQSGYVNADKVVYSLYLGTSVGDFTFNWVGLLADDDTLVAVRYIEPVSKYQTAGGELGNAITRNFLITYTDAQAITNITVDAATWQFSFDNVTQSYDGMMSSEDKKKLDEIEIQATKNMEDSELLDRANHVGEQEIQTVSGLDDALNQRIGLGQSWQNVNGSRAIGVTYTNTSNRPIHVNAQIGVTDKEIIMKVDDVWASSGRNPLSGTSIRFNLTAIVPPGSTYTVEEGVGNGNSSLAGWSELK